VSSVRYELGVYIPEDIFHIHRRGNLKSYISPITSVSPANYHSATCCILKHLLELLQ
jgi:hypothetical protein